MAIFTADEYGSAIEHCWLNGKDVARLATCASIPSIDITTIAIPPLSGTLAGIGWVDILDADDEGHIIAGPDGKTLIVARHYGTVKLEWANV